jgi:hypothetical protein
VVQPFDYSIRSTAQGPLQALSQGMQLGQQFVQSEQQLAQIEEARQAAAFRRQMAAEQQRIEAEKLRQAQEAAAAEQAARQAYFADPTPTMALRWQATLTPQMAKELNPGIERLNAEQIAALNKSSLSDYALLTSGRADMVAGGLTIEARARREAQDEAGARRLEAAAELARTSPKAAAATLLAQVINRPGGPELVDKFNNAMKSLQAEDQGRYVSSPEDKKKLGLTDDRGAPVPGTFFVQSGRAAQLVEGAKRPPITITTDEQKRQYGLVGTDGKPLEGVWGVEPGKNPERLDRGPLVQVSMPGQPAPATPLQKKLDDLAAGVVMEWRFQGGAENSAARIAQLQDVVKTLDRFPNITGPQMQFVPEWARPILTPATVEATQNAQRIIQEGIKPILGAQVTAMEVGEFLKRAFDPALGTQVNARRLRLILEQMKTSAKQAEALASYVEEKGSAVGFRGVVPSLSQFEAAIARGGGAPAAGAARRETTTTLPTPADQTTPLPAGGARATPAPVGGGGASAPVITTPTPGAGGRARTVDEILQQYRSRQ